MQTLIDFLVNNYLWFIIISLILIFALIGYLVDTSEKMQKGMEEMPEETTEGPIKVDTVESMNMDMGTSEPIKETMEPIIIPPLEKEKAETEVLDI